MHMELLIKLFVSRSVQTCYAFRGRSQSIIKKLPTSRCLQYLLKELRGNEVIFRILNVS